VTPCCILHWRVRFYRCKMQRGVEPYRHMMQRGVKSYRCMMKLGVKSYCRMMQQRVNLAVGSPKPNNLEDSTGPYRDNHVQNNVWGTFTILQLAQKLVTKKYNF
jgi:hypothetical protein